MHLIFASVDRSEAQVLGEAFATGPCGVVAGADRVDERAFELAVGEEKQRNEAAEERSAVHHVHTNDVRNCEHVDQLKRRIDEHLHADRWQWAI